jgi:hypothetical protein
MVSKQKARTMYQVEKFIPSECPKCRKVFGTEAIDYVLRLGDIVDGKKQIRTTKGYDIIICKHCRNETARVYLESAIFRKKEKAEQFIKEKGFTNLQKVKPMGNTNSDLIVRYKGGVSIEAITSQKIDEEKLHK